MSSLMFVKRSRQRGATLVGVLACLLIGTLLIGLIVQAALRGRREARLERQLAQTEWLCEGGAIRAIAALKKSADYSGETWQPELDLEPFRAAEVEITVDRKPSTETVADDANTKINESKTETNASTTWIVRVVARLDSTTDADGPMQRSLAVTVQQPKETNTNSEKSE